MISIGQEYIQRGNGTYTYQSPRITKDYLGGTLQLYGGNQYRIKVADCCVHVEAGGFFGGRLKGPPMAGGARLVGGATFSVFASYTLCPPKDSVLEGTASLTVNGGVRWEFNPVLLGTGFKAFVEAGIAGTWSWDVATLKYKEFKVGGYVRGVAEFLVADQIKRRHEYRVSIGDVGHIGN